MAVATQWNTAKPAMGNQVSSDIPDIEENFEEIQRILECITNGTLGTTDSDVYKVDSIADGVVGEAQLVSGTLEMPKNHITGLVLSNDTDTEHDINVTAGEARDATDAVDMVLAAEITKQFDAEWAVGDDAGGFAAGESLPTSGTIHIWLIKRSDTGVVDVIANDHATSALAPALPADYDYKRRIGSRRTDGSANIINGDYWGTGLLRTFMFDTPILDINVATPGTNAVTATLSIPAGIIVKALFNAYTSNSVYFSALCNADLQASRTAAPLISTGGASEDAAGGGQNFVISNTSSQIRYRTDANAAVKIATLGWIDSL